MEELNPYVGADSLLNSGAAMGLNFISDYAVAHYRQDFLREHLGYQATPILDSDQKHKFGMFSGKPKFHDLGVEGNFEFGIPKNSESQKFNKAYMNRLKETYTSFGQSHLYPQGTSETITGKRDVKKHSEIHRAAQRRYFRDLEKTDFEAIGDKNLKKSLKNLQSWGGIRSLGVAALTISASSLGFGLASGTLRYIQSRGRQTRSIDEAKGPLMSEQFMDTSAAHTSRQRAMRAIQTAGGGLRRALGNEAQYLRTYG